MPKQLRAIFVTILVHNAPSNPAALWNLHIIEGGHLPVPLYTYLAHDFYHSRTDLHYYSDVNEGDIAIAYHTIDDIICDITKNEKALKISLCAHLHPNDHLLWEPMVSLTKIYNLNCNTTALPNNFNMKHTPRYLMMSNKMYFKKLLGILSSMN